MTAKWSKSSGGTTLVEVLTATAVLSVAVIGASAYRYYAALDARKAASLTTAAKLALLLSENWRGLKGAETYDPTAHLASELAITTIEDGSIQAEGQDFTLLGGYAVILNDVTYHAILSWKDVDTGLRALNVVVVWSGQGPGAVSIAEADVSFTITTYALN